MIGKEAFHLQKENSFARKLGPLINYFHIFLRAGHSSKLDFVHFVNNIFQYIKYGTKI